MAGFHLLCTGPLEIQGLSSGRVTLSVLLGWGAAWIRASSPPGGRESRNRQTDSWPLDSRQKGPSSFQVVCLCDESSLSPLLPQLTLQRVPSCLNPNPCS